MTLRFERLSSGRFDEWRSETRAHLTHLQQDSGVRPGPLGSEFIDGMLSQTLPEGADSPSALILGISDSESEIGSVWLALAGEKSFIMSARFTRDLTEEEAAEIAEHVEEQARSAGATALSLDLFHRDPGMAQLINGRGFARSSVQMVLGQLPERPVDDRRVTVARMTEERFSRFTDESETLFAQDLEATGRMTRAEAVAEARRQFELELPQGLATPDQHLYSAQVDGEEVGIIWFAIRSGGEQRHAFILDVAVDESHRRRGYGRAIMIAAEREARHLDVHSIGLHVFAANSGAQTLYEQLGYDAVLDLMVLSL